MEFELKDLHKSINDIMRSAGYQPAYFQRDGQFSVVRPLGRNDYPRFHLYIKSSSPIASSSLGKDFHFNLHLDQKKPSYEGQKDHNGEYEGDTVAAEAERIKQLLNA